MAIKASIVLPFVVMLGLSVTIAPSSISKANPKPHFVLMVADDLGWNDVSWHNKKVLTPNMEALAKNGVTLNQSYVQPICTPTRAALLTGRYPFTIGRQRGVLRSEEPTGLTMKTKLLPEALKEAGYSTHIVGKWHLGYCSWDYTPTSRGFDTFGGFYSGSQDYYSHESYATLRNLRADFKKFGYDFRNNSEIEWSVHGEYSTNTTVSYIENLLEARNEDNPMFLYVPFQSVHDPLQVPEKYVEPFKHIKARKRRIKFGMILALDEAVGRIVEALKRTRHYNNTVIVFTTDNGAVSLAHGNNWPLRGGKSTLWEGGTRGVAFVHSPHLLSKSKGTISNKLMHVTDWYPTLVGLGGGVVPENINGYDQWKALTTAAPSPRTKMVYNIDYHKKMKVEMKSGIRMGDYKLLVGFPGNGKWHQPPEGIPRSFSEDSDEDIERSMNDKITSEIENDGVALAHLGLYPFGDSNFNTLLNRNTTIRLYNITDDPVEMKNLAMEKPSVVAELLKLLQSHMKNYVEPDIAELEEGSNPVYWNNTWSPGWCNAK